MQSSVTSKEKILAVSRELLQKNGWAGVSIRAVAGACNISIGSVYNYFPSKSALMGAAVQSIWREIFYEPKDAPPFSNTLAYVTWLYGRLAFGGGQYPGFFTLHSLGFLGGEKQNGKDMMGQMWQAMTAQLCRVVQGDPQVRADAFSSNFTAEMFAELLFSLLLAAMVRQTYDAKGVREIVQRLLY